MKLKVAIAQADCVLGNKEINIAKAFSLIEAASRKNADIILFPELFLTGYNLQERVAILAEPYGGKTILKIGRKAKKNRIRVIMGFPELNPLTGKIFNSVCMIDKIGKPSLCYRKTHLFGDEKKYFAAGNDFVVSEMMTFCFGMMICYDLYFPEVARILRLKGAQVLFVSSADWKPAESKMKAFVKSRAIENCAYTIVSNRVGVEEDFHFFGGSCIIDPEGTVVCQAGRTEELIFGEINVELIGRVRSQMHLIPDRRPDTYGSICGK